LPSEDGQKKPACYYRNAAAPRELECASCGAVVEIWSDEDEVLCPACGKVIKAC